MMLPPVLISKSNFALNVKLASGARKKSGVPPLDCTGFASLKPNDGTRGRRIASETATLFKDSRGEHENPEQMHIQDTHRIMRKKKVQTNTLRVNQEIPQTPRLSCLHSFHFSARAKAFSSSLPCLVIDLSSAFDHSGPNFGTVTISTGSDSSGSAFESPGVESARYLFAHFTKFFQYVNFRDQKGLLTLYDRERH